MYAQLAARGYFTHVPSYVQISFSGNRATSSAHAALNALEQLVFLGKFLSIHR
jgi:hypothetical protein